MTTTDPRARLDEIKARAEAATEGPWEHDSGGEISQHYICPQPWQTVVSREVDCMAYCYGGSSKGIVRDEDAEFIAHARTDNPDMAAALIDVLDALDGYPVPSRQADPTGQILDAMEGLEKTIRSRITKALGGDRG